MYKVIALIGKSGVGKDTVLNEVCKNNKDLNKKISTTTRPPRDYEKDGVDYFFLNNEEFANKILNFEMAEASDFREWFYGTEYRSLSKEKINIGAFNPDGVKALIEDGQVDLLVIYITASTQTRLIRGLLREKEPDVEEIFRRYKSDEIDFSDLDFEYYEVSNEKRDLKEVSEEIEKIIKKHNWTNKI